MTSVNGLQQQPVYIIMENAQDAVSDFSLGNVQGGAGNVGNVAGSLLVNTQTGAMVEAGINDPMGTGIQLLDNATGGVAGSVLGLATSEDPMGSLVSMGTEMATNALMSATPLGGIAAGAQLLSSTPLGGMLENTPVGEVLDVASNPIGALTGGKGGRGKG